ncbi:MAG: hypothetical protein WCA44_05735 [Acidobacteriaceae bacterium]
MRGEVETPALVVQSSQQADGEHLQVVSLDPAKASPLLSGQNVDAAIRKDYVTPLENGKTFGWKERPALPTGGEPSEETGEQKDLETRWAKGPADEFVENIIPHLQELSATVAKIAPEMNISPDGTLISANTLLTEDHAAHDALAKAHDTAIEELKKVTDNAREVDEQNIALKEEVASLHAKITEMEAILNQAPEPAPPQPNAAEQLDAAQGEVEPGDPESPHAPDAPQQ